MAEIYSSSECCKHGKAGKGAAFLLQMILPQSAQKNLKLTAF
jgi:hypothetical protein